MRETPKKAALALAASAVAAVGAVGIADAASSKKHAKRHTAASASAHANNESVLTGATAQSAKDAALAAVPGGTVTRASTEDPNDPSGAKYEVHVTKSDGTQVEVLEDSAFKVLSTKASSHRGGRHGHGHDGRGNAAEPELTGAAAQSAKDAALAAVPGGTVTRASKEDPKDASGAAYEVHVTKSDGTEVEVLEDASFKVLSTKAGH
jgi:uncharacterized membrane protein YkoI